MKTLPARSEKLRRFPEKQCRRKRRYASTGQPGRELPPTERQIRILDEIDTLLRRLFKERGGRA